MSGYYSFRTLRVKANVVWTTQATASAFVVRSIRPLFLLDAERQGKCPLQEAHYGICLPDEECQGILLQYAAYFLQTQSVQANVVWTACTMAPTFLIRSVRIFAIRTQSVKVDVVRTIQALHPKGYGSGFGYGPGRKVSETRHKFLGRHPETGQPTPSGLSFGRLTLQHWRIPGQVPAQTGKVRVLPQRKTTLVVIIRTSDRKEMGTQGVASLGRGIGAGLFPGAQHHKSGITVLSQMARRAEAIPLHCVVRRFEG